LFLAAENGHASCINVLLQFCPELPVFKLSPLCAAVSRSHVSCVKLLLNKSLINQASNGFTPLMRAVIRCDAEVVKLLLDAGAVEQASGHSSHASSESHDMDLLLRQADCAGKEDKVIAIKSLLEQHRKSKL
jgi:ankyrin repeat protein